MSLLSVKVQSSNVFQVGALYKVNDWFFEQAYSRLISGLNSCTYDFDNISKDQFYIGDSEINGIDILIRKKFRNVQSWLSYTISKTQFNFNKYSRDDFAADHDQRHTIKWTNQIEFGKLNASFGVRYASGLPFTTIESFDFENSPQSNEPVLDADYSRINIFRLDHLLELNLGLKYQMDFGDSRVHLSMGCMNFNDRNNIYNRNYYVQSLQDVDPSIKFTDSSSLPLTFDFSIRYEF